MPYRTHLTVAYSSYHPDYFDDELKASADRDRAYLQAKFILRSIDHAVDSVNFLSFPSSERRTLTESQDRNCIEAITATFLLLPLDLPMSFGGDTLGTLTTQSPIAINLAYRALAGEDMDISSRYIKDILKLAYNRSHDPEIREWINEEKSLFRLAGRITEHYLIKILSDKTITLHHNTPLMREKIKDAFKYFRWDLSEECRSKLDERFCSTYEQFQEQCGEPKTKKAAPTILPPNINPSIFDLPNAGTNE